MVCPVHISLDPKGDSFIYVNIKLQFIYKAENSQL